MAESDAAVAVLETSRSVYDEVVRRAREGAERVTWSGYSYGIAALDGYPFTGSWRWRGEGDSPTHGTHPGRVAWLDLTTGAHTMLRDDMYCPHSLQVEDFTGNGAPDIYVAEMGLGENERARHVLFANRGNGVFDEHIVARRIPTHEAKAVDLTGNGRLDIVGKSYGPDCHVDVWYNDIERAQVGDSPSRVVDSPIPNI